MADVRCSHASESLMAAMVPVRPSNPPFIPANAGNPSGARLQSHTHDTRLCKQQNEIQNPLLVDATWVAAICDVAIAGLTDRKLRRCVEVTQTASENKN